MISNVIWHAVQCRHALDVTGQHACQLKN
jgi:hypothetical protein